MIDEHRTIVEFGINQHSRDARPGHGGQNAFAIMCRTNRHVSKPSIRYVLVTQLVFCLVMMDDRASRRLDRLMFDHFNV